MKSLELLPTQDVLLDSFVQDSVGRSALVLRLAELINSIEGHFSIAIDGKWGSGKTFFVKQVKLVLDAFNSFGVQSLSEEEKTAIKEGICLLSKRRRDSLDFDPQVCVYYDAWENDNDEDPVLSLVYCILQSIQADYSFREEKDLFLLSASIIDCFAGTSAKDVVQYLRSDDPLENLKRNKQLHQTINSFFDELLKERGNRLVIFVDELDRCKPTFAVKLLERIKHYFTNDNITFIFSVNSEAMLHTIRNYYGQGFDASRYFDRFFDLSMALPPVVIDNYLQYIGTRNSSFAFSEYRKAVIKKFRLEMREIIRFFSITESAAYNATHSRNSFGFSYEQAYLLSLIYVFPVAIALRITNLEEYNRFISGENGTPLIELLSDRTQYSGLYRQLLSSGETYDEPSSGCPNKVTPSDKIQSVYTALFTKQYGRDEYEANIGDACFSIETRNDFFRLLSLLSDDANYCIP